MSETKFSPGPWYPGHLGSDGKCQCRSVVDEGHAGGICLVNVDNGKTISEGGNDAPPLEEAVANMHLIASSPHLYLALECVTLSSGWEHMHQDDKDVVLRAMAEARGEQ